MHEPAKKANRSGRRESFDAPNQHRAFLPRPDPLCLSRTRPRPHRSTRLEGVTKGRAMSYRTAVWALMILMSGVYPSAQTQAPAPPKQPAKGGMFSIYKPSELVDLGTRREDTLESRVRDGRLELTEADVVQLALQNNVDIQVERYAPVYNLWQMEKSRGILNPSLTLAATHNYK